MRGLFGVLIAALVAGCAHAPPPAATPAASTGADAPSPLPLPRSSIAAILLHRGELDLSDDQVERLQERDDELYKVQTTLQMEAAHRQQAKAAQDTPSATSSPGGRHSHQPRPQPDPKPTQSLNDQLDDNDTRAYLSAETDILREAQRDAAREIASQYREALYDQRATQKQ